MSADDMTAPSDGLSPHANGALAPGSPYAPEHVADALVRSAHQDPSAWRDEVAFDEA